ncbi:MAG: hypothetical protein EZS28_054047 [Streblomastix strix]|uniref:Uncharacterized protein n=1 Tax=Streblomastix strix TaxID=222440 RepID=A0A5J4QWA8_9EUKA|nr:MAG: hypothetical protein EZS28_054047 [Streblomastix strix]
MDRIMMIELKVYIARREQAIPPVQTATGAPVYMSNLRIAQEEAIHRRNNISPNIDEDSSVSWTIPESINLVIDIPISNFRTAQQLLAAQDNQE